MSVRLRNWKDSSGKVQESWYVDIVFRHADGQRERIKRDSPVNTRRAAEEYERQIRESLLRGTFGKEEQQVPTLVDFKDRFLLYSRNNNKPSMVYAKEGILQNHLVPAFGKMKLDQIDFEKVEAYKDKKRKTLAPKTVNNHLAILLKLLNLAAEYKIISSSPQVKLFKLEEPKHSFLSFEEADRFLAAADPEWKTMIIVALKTGLRPGELLALKWEDVDLVAKRIVVRRTLWNGQEGPPKGRKQREIGLSNAAVKALRTHRHLKGPYVFCRLDGSRLTHSEIKRIVPAICRKAGLAKRITWHGLRHTFASHLVMRGVPLKAVQELLGHATIQMTMRYAHLSPDMKRDAVLLLDDPHPARPYGGNEVDGEALENQNAESVQLVEAPKH